MAPAVNPTATQTHTFDIGGGYEQSTAPLTYVTRLLGPSGSSGTSRALSRNHLPGLTARGFSPARDCFAWLQTIPLTGFFPTESFLWCQFPRPTHRTMQHGV